MEEAEGNADPRQLYKCTQSLQTMTEELRLRIKTLYSYLNSCTNPTEAFAKIEDLEYQAQSLNHCRTQPEGRVRTDIAVQMFRSSSVYYNTQ